VRGMLSWDDICEQVDYILCFLTNVSTSGFVRSMYSVSLMQVIAGFQPCVQASTSAEDNIKLGSL